MRGGNLFNRINFFAKQITRDDYGASSDSYNYSIPTITTRGEIRWAGGNRIVENEEKTYTRNMELTIRYRSTIIDTMRIQVIGSNDLYAITYIEVIGRNESLRLTLEKLSDGLLTVLIDAPTGLSISLSDYINAVLEWTNNTDDDAISIERSSNGNAWVEIARTNIEVETYTDEDLDEETRYFYRIRSFKYNNYSQYTDVEVITTTLIVL
jgi:head-tail adaptor